MSVTKKIARSIKEAVNPTNCLDQLEQIVLAYKEYKIFAEQEQTKRQEIEAWEQATIAKSNAQRDVLINYLERSFDEQITFALCLV